MVHGEKHACKAWLELEAAFRFLGYMYQFTVMFQLVEELVMMSANLYQ